MADCEACEFAAAEGWWGNTIPSNSTHCSGCHQTMKGSQKWGHCVKCHRTFSGVGTFDRHQQGRETDEVKESPLCATPHPLMEGKGITKYTGLVLETNEFGEYWIVELSDEARERFAKLREAKG